MAGSVVQRLERVQDIFRKKGAWVKMVEALNEEGLDVKPDDPDAVQFCLLGAAKRVGDGQKMLLALAQAIDPKFDLKAWHADYHDLELKDFKPKRDCVGNCGFDVDDILQDTITGYNDATNRSLPDIRRVVSKAKKLAKAV